MSKSFDLLAQTHLVPHGLRCSLNIMLARKHNSALSLILENLKKKAFSVISIVFLWETGMVSNILHKLFVFLSQQMAFGSPGCVWIAV